MGEHLGISARVLLSDYADQSLGIDGSYLFFYSGCHP